MVAFATPRLLAKQWLRMYQFGPQWVMPTVLTGTLANAGLAVLAFGHDDDNAAACAYAVAAAAVLSILPMTFVLFEPGINGACKWKVESLLRDEGFKLPPPRPGRPSAARHSASETARRWADGASMHDLVRYWGKVNHVRWVTGLVAAGASGWASLYCRQTI